jgi:hypothetical protein
MVEALIAAGAAIVVGVLSLVGVIITNNRANNKMQSEARADKAVMKEQISELTREVRMHNDFARRIPVIEEKVKSINRRIDDLEEFHKPN